MLAAMKLQRAITLLFFALLFGIILFSTSQYPVSSGPNEALSLQTPDRDCQPLNVMVVRQVAD
jgi:hypothetical protein